MTTEIRCGHCRRKLGEGDYIRLAIKCPRCGTLNCLSATRVPHPERPGTPTERSRSDDKSVTL
ncbi:MAG: Com family DNA-binding transcriptional regulator [Rhodocyclaceae bacterium]|nr:Com family DNA-binding transcriptional regulator [Rhodocyclaceae bacterium]